VIEKRWIRAIVVFVATGVLLIAQDYVRDEKPPKLEPPKEIVERVTGQAATPYVLEGNVDKVIDGDTLSLRTTQSGVQRIRLASIDAPERSGAQDRPGQPFGDQAQQFLAQHVQGANVRLTCYEQDPYERHICDVQDPQGGTETINRALVSEGLAWANMEGKGKFLRDDAMTGLQEQAKANKAGLWSQPEPVAPWVWRYQCWRNGQCG
jgi:micrococcal nuclease